MQRLHSYYLILGFSFLALLLGLLSVVGPSEGEKGDWAENEVVFQGEGQNWTARISERQLQVISEEGETTKTMVRRVIKYKGGDLAGIGEVDYYLDGARGTATGTHRPDGEGKIILPVIEGDFAAAEKTDIWTLVLKWEGGEEIIELKAR